jgi:amino acid adenylation domain-containing protein
VKTSEFLTRLNDLNVKVWEASGELKVSAPKGVMTAELRDELGRRKAEILAVLGAASTTTAAHVDRAVTAIPRQPRTANGLPLSFTQQRLWFLQQLEPELAAYNIPLGWRLVGALDVPALERALSEVVRRHEALRMTFPDVGGRPTQVALEPQAIRFGEVEDARGRTDAEWRDEIKRRMLAQIESCFDLRTGPLFRCSLVRVDADEHILFITVHHIVFDGLSIGVLLRELIALYDAFSKGRPSPLPEIAVQYADFAAWQQEHYRGATYKRLVDYWKKVLGGSLPIVELPTDRPRPPMQTFHGAHKERLLPRSLIKSIEELAQREGVTLYMVLLAAYKTLLARYTGLDDLIVGTAINNRSRPEVQELIGFFANTLVLRTDGSGDPTFRELLARVKEVCLSAYEHQDMPFERLVDELALERNLAYSPIFQTMFLVEWVPNAPTTAGEITFKPFVLDAVVARADLTLWVALDAERFFAWAEYNTDLFDPSTMDDLLDHYVEIVQSALRDPGARLSRIGMLPESERARLVEEWNATEAAFPEETLHARVEGMARSRPSSIALVYPSLTGGQDEEVTYAELDERANRIARHLAQRGVKPGDLVGLCLDRSTGMVESVLGILKTGAAYVPLDPAFPRERLTYMAEDAKLALVVTRRELAELVGGVEHVLLDEEASSIAAHPPTPLGGATSLSGAAEARSRMYVIYTSGSTGRPKGVELEHRSVSNFQSSMQREPGFRAGETLLAVTTLSFDISVLEVMLPLVSGGTVIVAPKEAVGDGSKLIGLLERLRPDVMQATPATWRLLLLSGWKGAPNLRIFSGGEALPRDLAEELLSKGAEVWNLYGPTETTIWSTVKKVEHGEGPVTIGRPIGNTRVYVLDRNQELSATGVPGELWIGGEGLARGYLDRPELTSERFVADPYSKVPGARMYRTGDVARWKRGKDGAPGELECLGRIDNQVKLRGFRIELGEIESVLTEVEGVRQCVCLVKDAGGGDQRLVAYWLRDEGHEGADLESALRSKAAERLPSYMGPSVYAELEAFPHTPNGKVDRKALSKLELARSVAGKGASEAAVAPETELESKIAKVWGEVLKLSEVSVTRNFFDLGGHSLLLAEAHARVQATIEPDLTIVEMFQYPSVRALATHLENRGAIEGGSAGSEERGRDLASGRQALMQRRRVRR